jgi:MHS family alpha-ketoglutarate permease-like MFS transporter
MSKQRTFISLFGGSVGNLIEWYDWYTYSSFAVYFAASFFPKGDQTSQLLNAAAVFAVGFLARPVGGWWFGRYADRHGRRAALTLSITLMCLGSLVIALCPTYATFGVGAPIVLVLARTLQGFSVGGEYGTSATYLSEIVGHRWRGFFSSFQYVTLILGQLLAVSVAISLRAIGLTHEDLTAWGWRIPFAIGALAAVLAFVIRRRMLETEAFTSKRADIARAGQLTLLWEHRRAALTVVGLTMGATLTFYTYTTYMQKFLINTVGLSTDSANEISAATLLCFMFLQPIFGALSDVIGRKPQLIAFGTLGVLTTVPIMTSLETANTFQAAFLFVLAGLTTNALYTSISAVVKAELFPAEIRALGVGLPYALAVSIFGGTAEYIALWFKGIGHERIFYWYVTACIGCSLVVYIRMRDTRKTSLI